MFKKKEKIEKKESFDSLLLPFNKEMDTNIAARFRMSSNDNKCNVTLNIFKEIVDELDNSDESIVTQLFDKNNHDSRLSYFKESINEKGEVFFYVLILKDFLENAKEIKIILSEIDNGNKFMDYCIKTYYDDLTIQLSFRESDMYPSVVKYIIDTTTEAMYKKTL